MFKEHEKFIAFALLGASLVGLAVMVYLKPPSQAITDNGGAFAMLNTIVGALVLAFGGAANALFKISSSEKADIAQQTANAMQSGEPMPTKVVNDKDEAIPTTDTPPHSVDQELPEYAR